MKGKVREKWVRLTSDEIAGKRDQLEGKLQGVYGKTKEEARREVDETCAACAGKTFT